MSLPKTKEELLGKYYLKNDLINICKKYGLPKSGSKENLLEYISNFIENKPIEKIKITSKVSNNDFKPSLEKLIDTNYSNNEIHRDFFKKVIGNNFKFNVQFMNWLGKNKGEKTYKEAVEKYNKILLNKYYATFEQYRESILTFSKSKSKKLKKLLLKYIPEKFHLIQPAPA
jgi:hypothetical protein